MKHFALQIAYDGSYFSGFAPQKTQGVISVSETIQKALMHIGIDSSVIAAGRTDKGVHALGMVAMIQAREYWEIERLRNALNKNLYPHIYIRKIWEVDSSFHPRFSAKKRGYYYIFTQNLNNPFHANYVSSEQIGDIKIFQKCLESCIGKHNFAYFKKQGSNNTSDEREIFRTYLRILKRFGKTYYLVYIEGNSFLRAQIRLMIGAMLCVSRNEMSFDEFMAQLYAQSRIHTKPASPQGLYFGRVVY